MQSQLGVYLRTSQVSQISASLQMRQFNLQSRQSIPLSYIPSGQEQLGKILFYKHCKHPDLLQEGQCYIEHYVQF